MWNTHRVQITSDAAHDHGTHDHVGLAQDIPKFLMVIFPNACPEMAALKDQFCHTGTATEDRRIG